jgi:hypothetical protein
VSVLNLGARRRLQSVRWEHTRIGAPAAWPAEWRRALVLCLTTSLPMVLALGPELECFGNDGYAHNIGYRQPPIVALLRHVAHCGQPMLMLNVENQRREGEQLGLSCRPLSGGAAAVALETSSAASLRLLVSLHDPRSSLARAGTRQRV